MSDSYQYGSRLTEGLEIVGGMGLNEGACGGKGAATACGFLVENDDDDDDGTNLGSIRTGGLDGLGGWYGGIGKSRGHDAA